MKNPTWAVALLLLPNCSSAGDSPTPMLPQPAPSSDVPAMATAPVPMNEPMATPVPIATAGQPAMEMPVMEPEPEPDPRPRKVLAYSVIHETRLLNVPRCDATGEVCDYSYDETAKGYFHASIPAGDAMIKRLADELDFELTIYEGDQRNDVLQEFTIENLNNYRAIVSYNPNGPGMGPAQREAFKQFINQGGAWVGIHAAANSDKDWPWLHDFVGAFEVGVSGTDETELLVTPGISTEHLGATWTIAEEWHVHSRSAYTRPNLHFLLERGPQPRDREPKADIYPVSWWQEFEGGRMWYTTLGHNAATYEVQEFQDHVAAGLRWAAKLDE